jgi:hypothetical protein
VGIRVVCWDNAVVVRLDCSPEVATDWWTVLDYPDTEYQ